MAHNGTLDTIEKKNDVDFLIQSLVDIVKKTMNDIDFLIQSSVDIVKKTMNDIDFLFIHWWIL